MKNEFKSALVKQLGECAAATTPGNESTNYTFQTLETPKVYEPVPLKIKGVLKTPAVWLEKRKHLVDKDQATLIADQIGRAHV